MEESSDNASALIEDEKMATDAKCHNTLQERAYLTFDCEWCDNILNTTPSKDKLESRLLRQGFSRFLDVCEEQDAAGTIFVTAEVAPSVKDLLLRAVASGFEIGNHSKNHESVANLSIDQFTDDLKESTVIIEDTISRPVVSYRAPSFSMPIVLEYYEALAACGYRFDYSAPLGNHMSGVRCDSSDLLTILGSPTNVLTLPMVALGSNRNIFPGGGYFRVMPAWKLRELISHNTTRWPVCLYFHPRDLLPIYVPRNTSNLKKLVKAAAGGITPATKLKKVLASLNLMTTENYHESCRLALSDLRESSGVQHGV